MDTDNADNGTNNNNHKRHNANTNKYLNEYATKHIININEHGDLNKIITELI